MKTRTIKNLTVAAILTLGFSSHADVWTCYVQKEGAYGVYKDVVASKEISTNSSDEGTNIDLYNELQKDVYVHYSAQVKKDGNVTVYAFNPLDQSSLIMTNAQAPDRVMLILSGFKILVGCIKK